MLPAFGGDQLDWESGELLDVWRSAQPKGHLAHGPALALEHRLAHGLAPEQAAFDVPARPAALTGQAALCLQLDRELKLLELLQLSRADVEWLLTLACARMFCLVADDERCTCAALSCMQLSLAVPLAVRLLAAVRLLLANCLTLAGTALFGSLMNPSEVCSQLASEFAFRSLASLGSRLDGWPFVWYPNDCSHQCTRPPCTHGAVVSGERSAGAWKGGLVLGGPVLGGGQVGGRLDIALGDGLV